MKNFRNYLARRIQDPLNLLNREFKPLLGYRALPVSEAIKNIKSSQ